MSGPCATYERRTGYPPEAHGSTMGGTRGSPMGDPALLTHGLPTSYPWATHVRPMSYPWANTGNPCANHGLPSDVVARLTCLGHHQILCRKTDYSR